MANDPFKTLMEFPFGDGRMGSFYSLPALERAGFPGLSRLPVSLRLVLESVLRNVDGEKITEQHVKGLAAWRPNAPRTEEIPFVVSRVLLQDFTGVPLLADLAAMRGAASRSGADARVIEPLVPVHMVVDHSVQIDYFGTPDALRQNMQLEFTRNAERYAFMKWGMQAFNTFKVIPPGIGICHQINLEHLAKGVVSKDGLYYPDTLLGTDSHTTMINGIGVVGWGVGGIEAEAAMLGQPVYQLTPDVVGVELKGKLRPGVTATDLVLTVTEKLRKSKVVGKFVEFFGAGAAALPATDRATVANMAPEYGATMGFFPTDDQTLAYYRATGRTDEEVAVIENYLRAQGLFGVPKAGECDYSQIIEIDLSAVAPCVAGPTRPQDRVPLGDLPARFAEVFQQPSSAGGYNKSPQALDKRIPVAGGNADVRSIGHGDILIAAITSCTNTSNPGLLLAAGLVAKKAVERGLTVPPHVKTSLAPGSRVVTEYLRSAGLLPYLEKLGFGVAVYGCAACVGNVGPLDPAIEKTVVDNDLVCSAVLSGNRNFEARVHASIRANFLASPPLVIAFALTGRANVDFESTPLGTGGDGKPVYLADIWPAPDEVAGLLHHATDAATYRRLYEDFTKDHDLWNAVGAARGEVYDWPTSTYVAEPPFLESFKREVTAPADILGARALAILGDSITTDHISPAGSIKANSPAGRWLQSRGVATSEFNTYGARRGNHEVMARGTFANVRIRNLMIPPNADGSRVEGGFTIHQPDGERLSIYDAATRYIADGTPTLIFAGEEYGTGSSRDWAAKGTALLGVRAVIARSFERIHRANLVGMGVLPLQFSGTDSIQSLKLDGTESFDLADVEKIAQPGQHAVLTVRRADGSRQDVKLIVRVDTPVEARYFRHGGVLPFVFRSLTAA